MEFAIPEIAELQKSINDLKELKSQVFKVELDYKEMIREVKEECNLDFTPIEIIKTGVWLEKKYYRFLGNWSGEIKIQEEEVLDFNWFTFEKAMQLQLAFDYKEIVELLYKKKLL